MSNHKSVSTIEHILPDTFAARLDSIKWDIHNAQQAIEQEVERTPEVQKARRRFLKSISQQAERLWCRCEDYGSDLGPEDGFVAE